MIDLGGGGKSFGDQTVGGIAWIVLLCVLMAPCFQDQVMLPSQELQLDLFYRALQPGEVIKVVLSGSGSVNQVHLRFLGEKYLFARDPETGAHLTFVGLDLNTAAAVRPLVVTALLQDGTLRTWRKEIRIVSKQFPESRLRVNQKYVTPPEEVQERIRLEAELMRTVFATYSPMWLARGTFQIPIEGRLNPNFGERRFFNDQPRSPHSGVDISAPTGTLVGASNSGRVLLADHLYYAGNTVVIDHGLGVFSFYCHFSKLDVKKGDQVAKGEPIGRVGATGRVTGPHLHWSIRIKGSRVDPLSLVSLGNRQKIEELP